MLSTETKNYAKNSGVRIHVHVDPAAAFKRCCLRSGKFDGSRRNYFFQRLRPVSFIRSPSREPDVSLSRVWRPKLSFLLRRIRCTMPIPRTWFPGVRDTANTQVSRSRPGAPLAPLHPRADVDRPIQRTLRMPDHFFMEKRSVGGGERWKHCRTGKTHKKSSHASVQTRA